MSIRRAAMVCAEFGYHSRTNDIVVLHKSIWVIRMPVARKENVNNTAYIVAKSLVSGNVLRRAAEGTPFTLPAKRRGTMYVPINTPSTNTFQCGDSFASHAIAPSA